MTPIFELLVTSRKVPFTVDSMSTKTDIYGDIVVEIS